MATNFYNWVTRQQFQNFSLLQQNWELPHLGDCKLHTTNAMQGDARLMKTQGTLLYNTPYLTNLSSEFLNLSKNGNLTFKVSDLNWLTPAPTRLLQYYLYYYYSYYVLELIACKHTQYLELKKYSKNIIIILYIIKYYIIKFNLVSKLYCHIPLIFRIQFLMSYKCENYQ